MRRGQRHPYLVVCFPCQRVTNGLSIMKRIISIGHSMRLSIHSNSLQNLRRVMHLQL